MPDKKKCPNCFDQFGVTTEYLKVRVLGRVEYYDPDGHRISYCTYCGENLAAMENVFIAPQVVEVTSVAS